MSKRIRLPGPRDVRGSLDRAGETDEDAETVVVACPPHPQMGGDRHDSRLQGVSDAVTVEGVDCLRIDYGPWDEGYGERTDVRNALGWAMERYDQVALFGFSFGAVVALLAAVPEGDNPTPDVLSVLAPAAQVTDDFDAVAALEAISYPVQVVYGERDDTAEWRPVVERARECGLSVTGVAADHHFVGQTERVASPVVSFLSDHLGPARFD